MIRLNSLEYHIQTRESGFEIKMLPTWRPDKAMAVEVPADFRAYVEKLAEVSDVAISCFDDMVAALRKRHDFFAEQGCKLSPTTELKNSMPRIIQERKLRLSLTRYMAVLD